MPKRVPTFRPPGAAIPGPDRHRQFNRRRAGTDRLYGTAAWQKLRALKKATDPLCEPCRAEGRLTPVEIVHHKATVRIHGEAEFFALENLESVCRSCHARIHAGEDRHPVGGRVEPRDRTGSNASDPARVPRQN